MKAKALMISKPFCDSYLTILKTFDFFTVTPATLIQHRITESSSMNTTKINRTFLARNSKITVNNNVIVFVLLLKRNHHVIQTIYLLLLFIYHLCIKLRNYAVLETCYSVIFYCIRTQVLLIGNYIVSKTIIILIKVVVYFTKQSYIYVQ